jgi:hypothetical protein
VTFPHRHSFLDTAGGAAIPSSVASPVGCSASPPATLALVPPVPPRGLFLNQIISAVWYSVRPPSMSNAGACHPASSMSSEDSACTVHRHGPSEAMWLTSWRLHGSAGTSHPFAMGDSAIHTRLLLHVFPRDMAEAERRIRYERNKQWRKRQPSGLTLRTSSIAIATETRCAPASQRRGERRSRAKQQAAAKMLHRCGKRTPAP